MNQNFDEIADEEFEFDEPAEAELPEIESSALTWDEETVRETHREIALRSRRASAERLF